MQRLLIYDDRCGFCLTCVRIIRKLDWRQAHRYEGSNNQQALDQAGVTSEEADEELKLWVDGALYGGYDAVQKALQALPATFLLAPLMGFTPVRWLGRKVYKAIAARRKCTYAPISVAPRK